MNIKLDLNWPVLNTDGVPLQPEGQTAGRVLATALLGQEKGDALKVYPWCVALMEGKPLELDRPDFEMLYRLVELVTLPLVTKYPIQMAMLEAKDETSPIRGVVPGLNGRGGPNPAALTDARAREGAD